MLVVYDWEMVVAAAAARDRSNETGRRERYIMNEDGRLVW